MKKAYLLLSFLMALCIMSFAKEVPVNTAKTVGYNYLLQHGVSTLKSSDDLSVAYMSGTSRAYFYVFSSNNCFVIVSAEDAVIPVLGYSKEGAFYANNLPSNIRSIFDGYNQQIDWAIITKASASPDIETNWSNLLQNKASGRAARTTTVLPLINTTWDQTTPYNNDCPADAAAPAGYGGRVPTGCVATCVAQVMKFWSWPAQGIGNNSYATSSYGTLSANFGTTTYNWASMPNNVTSSNPAVATLMYDLGVALNMQYGPNESGSYVTILGSPITNCAEYALTTYFNYSAQGEERYNYSDAAWLSLIEGELNAGRPVVYDGDGTAGGHCFVADGFDASDNFHINWGWSGMDDGYYNMNALNPPSLGTGGGAGGFNSDQEAIIGVKPATSAPPAIIEMYDYINLNTTGIQYADTFNAATNIVNTSTTATFNGSLGFAAFDATTGAFVTFLDSGAGFSLPPSSYYNAPGITGYTLGSAAMIPGVYNIELMYHTAGTSWAMVPNSSSGPYTNGGQITVYNHNPIETYSTITTTPTPLVQGSSATVSVAVQNDDTSPWADSLYMGLYNMDGSWNSDIGYIAGTSLAVGASSGILNFNTSSITATPGSYLAVLWFKYSGAWYVAGADYDQNPVTVNVVAPAPVPDIYEVNNTAVTAYDLTSTLTWSSNTTHTGTPGSTIHISSDQDYYKLTFPAGYNYSISARVNDVGGTDDGLTYTADVLWSYSTNNGSTWSPTYNNTMSGNIVMTGGGTIIFHVSPAIAGSTGSYLLKMGTITRSTVVTSVPEVSLSAVNIYPNPASNFITVDLSGTEAKGMEVTFTDAAGKKVLSADITNQPVATISISNLASGMYLMSVITDAGILNKKISVSK